MTATFFVASGFLDGGRMWNDTVIESVRIARGPLLDLDALGCGVVADRQRSANGFDAIDAACWID